MRLIGGRSGDGRCANKNETRERSLVGKELRTALEGQVRSVPKRWINDVEEEMIRRDHYSVRLAMFASLYESILQFWGPN